MSELERILDSIKPEKLAFYALYGTKLSAERIHSYDVELENAYNKFLKFLEKQCPDIDTTVLNDNLLYFIYTYSEIYLEIGMVAGYVLHKEMKMKFHSLGMDAVIGDIADSDKS